MLLKNHVKSVNVRQHVKAQGNEITRRKVREPLGLLLCHAAMLVFSLLKPQTFQTHQRFDDLTPVRGLMMFDDTVLSTVF